VTQAAPRTSSSMWLILLYRLPANPVRYRAAVWRRLRALGAGNAKKAVEAVGRCENAVDALAAWVFRSDESRAPRMARKALR
jgi:hypothetical protein